MPFPACLGMNLRSLHRKVSRKKHLLFAGLQKPVKPKLKNKVMVTSRAWFGLTADTITSLANSYPITVEMKEMKNSWYSLESEYYLKQLKTATVILYVIDSTARWELHEERPLFEKFLNIIYGNQVSNDLPCLSKSFDESVQ